MLSPRNTTVSPSRIAKSARQGTRAARVSRGARIAALGYLMVGGFLTGWCWLGPDYLGWGFQMADARCQMPDARGSHQEQIETPAICHLPSAICHLPSISYRTTSAQ